MADQTELDALEERAARLFEHYQAFEADAAFHERHQHPDANTFRRRADAWKADYEAAVRDLERARG